MINKTIACLSIALFMSFTLLAIVRQDKKLKEREVKRLKQTISELEKINAYYKDKRNARYVEIIKHMEPKDVIEDLMPYKEVIEGSPLDIEITINRKDIVVIGMDRLRDDI